MTNEEYFDLINQLRTEMHLSDRDIAIGFFSLFYDDEINRKQLDALLAGIGFRVSDDYANMSDEELKSKIFKKDISIEGLEEPPEAFKGLNYDQIKEVDNYLNKLPNNSGKKFAVKMICVEFVNGNFIRRQLDYGLHKLGLSLSSSFKEMDDEELRKNLFKKKGKK